MSHGLYTLYRLTERIKQWFSSRFTDIGRFFLLIFCIALLFGVNVQRTMIYQILGGVFSLLLFAFFWSSRLRSKLKITRILPETCVAGRELRYLIQIENRGRRKVSPLYYCEKVMEPLPTDQEFYSSRETGEEKRNIFDQKMGYYRWLWLLRQNRRMTSCDQVLPEIAPMQKREMEVSLMPLRRGNIHLSGYKLTKKDPLGLCRRQTEYHSPQNLLVLPKLYSVPDLFFSGSRKYHQGGLIAAQNRGDSSEFLSLREYNYGDPIKHIDWKSTARAGKTMVKQYRDEYFCRYGLILDSFSELAYSPVFEEAVSVAASIMMTLDGHDSFLDLFFVGSQCITCTTGKGLADQRRMLELLASVATCRDQSFAVLTSLVKSQASLLSGIIVILIDVDKERNDLINYLLENKIPAKLLVIIDNKEEYAAKKKMINADAHLREIDINHMQEQLAQL